MGCERSRRTPLDMPVVTNFGKDMTVKLRKTRI